MREIHRQPIKETYIVKSNEGTVLKGVKFSKVQTNIVADMVIGTFILGLIIGAILTMIIL